MPEILVMNARIIIGASLFSLVVFLLIQFYTIINVYQVKSHDFDTRYNQVVREAVNELDNYSPDMGMDSMYWYLDRESYYFKDINYLDDTQLTDSLKQVFCATIIKIMNAFEPFSGMIAYKLNQNNMDPGLKAGYLIHDFSILDDFNEFIIIQNDTLLLKGKDPVGFNPAFRGTLLDNFRAEQNYFAINFDIYVDFTKKQQIIFGEMIGVLSLITLSFLIISFVYYYTIRNLMKQKKLSDLKSDFINNMTHELKTPLSTISLANSGLTNEEMMKDKNKLRELSDIIKRQSKHLTQIIDKILDISMWEKQKIKLDLKQADIVQLIREKIESFKLVNQDVNIQLNIPEERFVINADAFQISLALNNLLDNAVKYKKKTLDLKVEVKLDPGELSLMIKDNGIGISQAHQKQIFNKFYRVEGSTIHNTKGLGLGLFYVKNIIEAHGGEIRLKSELKKGTTFYIRFKK